MCFRFLLAAALSSATAVAQFDVVDEAWTRSLLLPSSASLLPVNVAAGPDGDVLVLGFGPDGAGEVVVTRLSKNGDVLWQDREPSPSPMGMFTEGRQVAASVTSEGVAYVVWSTPAASYLRRYGPDGAVAWTSTLTSTTGLSQYVGRVVAVSPAGNVIVGGVQLAGAYPRLDVRAFSPDGQSLWAWRGVGRPFDASRAEPSGIEIGPGGQIYLYGRDDFAGFPSRGTVVALDEDGGFLWQRLPLSGNPIDVAGLALDSAGNAVLVAGTFGTTVDYDIGIEKIAPDGTLLATTIYEEIGFRLTPLALAIDSLDRITVGGIRQVSASPVPTATLFFFDAAATYVTSATPSVLASGESSRIVALELTNRDDVAALGFTDDGSHRIVAGRFGPDGTERWAIRMEGQSPPYNPSLSTAIGVGLAADPRGNLLSIAQIDLAGPAGPTEALRITKFVQNGPAGSTYCSPAVANSTGAPAEMTALGPGELAANNITLRVDQLPPGTLTLFLASRTQGSAPLAGGGQGTLCLGGAIGRFYGPGEIRTAAAEGAVSLQLNLSDLPQPNGRVGATTGETWNFQVWYRDANPTLTSNFSSASSVML